ncbi:MAG: HlyD family efflux transporter periplasmic adaptor subunit [Candidatus Gracilibacteria bacterium]
MKAKILTLLKAWSGRILLAVVLLSVGAYFLLRGGETTEDYLLLGTVEQGDITLSISESGQVSDAEEIELTPEASAKVTGTFVDEGTFVTAGQLLLSLDSAEASFEVEDAQISLAQAQQDLEELGAPGDEIDIKRGENDVTEAENSITQLTATYETNTADLLEQIEDYQKDITDIQETDLPSAFNSAYNEVTNVFVDLPEAYGEIKDILQGSIQGQKGLSYYSDQIGSEGEQQQAKVESAFSEAQSYYNDALALYESSDREDSESLKELIDSTYEALSSLSDTLKELDVFLSMVYEEEPTDAYMLAHRETVAENIATINPYLSSIYTEVEGIDDLYESIEDTNDLIAEAQQDILDLEEDYTLDLVGLNLTLEEKQLDLEDLQNSDTDELDYRAQELVVRQRENTLAKAQEAYGDYFLYAAVDGYIATWDVSEGDSVSSSTVVGTLIDNNKQVVVSLNELDILDIELGQTAKVSFDAIPDFEAEGVVVKKDISGTVTSGVVTYEVTLSVQSDDERILTGMSAAVDIVLLSKPGVTLVSKVAIKEDRDGKYVELVKNADSLEMQPFYTPDAVETEKVYLEVGDEDEVNAEVLSGVEVGDRIVLSTISLSSEEENASTGFALPGGGGGAGSGEFTPPSGANFEGGPPSF